jgi:hypothetical protein
MPPSFVRVKYPSLWAASLLAPRTPQLIRGVSKLTAHLARGSIRSDNPSLPKAIKSPPARIGDGLTHDDVVEQFNVQRPGGFA